MSRQPLAETAEDREAGVKPWQTFDSKRADRIKGMLDGHGYANHYVPADQVDRYPTVLAGFGLGYTTARWSKRPSPQGREGRRPSQPRIVNDTLCICRIRRC